MTDPQLREQVRAHYAEAAARSGSCSCGAELYSEADVDAAQLEKAAAERAAGHAGGSEHRKERAAANQYVCGRRRKQDDFVRAVLGPDDQAIEREQLVDLHAATPVVRAPRAQHARGGDRDGGIDRRLMVARHLILWQ